MMKLLSVAAAVLLVCVLTLAVAEGIYSVARWDKSSGSVTYQTARLLGEKFAAPEPAGPEHTQLLEMKQIEHLKPKLMAMNAGMGNSRIRELRTEAASVNRQEDGCRIQKPHVKKVMTYLRSNLFNPLDPVTLFWDADLALDAEVKAMIEKYAVRLTRHTTNEFGERVTLPAVSSAAKVIIAGDSVANGSMLDDSETLASQLQAQDLSRQYVNVGIGGATTGDIICVLEKAARRYEGEMVELIYVYCENDFLPELKYGSPEEAIAWLSQFAKENGIRKVTVVYAPYIYNVVPQYTRFRQYNGEDHGTFARERAVVKDLTAKAGFRYIDIADIALAEADRMKTQFAALTVFNDHVHLSPYGTMRLTEILRMTPAE